MHKQLKRLLKKYFPKDAEFSSFETLFEKISEAFDQLDEDREMLERSLLLTSKELNSSNNELRERLNENKINQELLKHQAFHDALTNLPNRILVEESLQHAIDLANAHHRMIAVLFIDLDDFKKVNDTAGHQAGDSFLLEASHRIRSCLHGGEILGRLGGDEFLVILENVETQKQISPIVHRIISCFEKPFCLSSSQYFFSCSMGISFYPQDGSEPESLIRKADMAMYQAKRNGKKKSHYYDESLQKIANHRVNIETNLRSALNNDEFHLLYQPKVCLNTGHCHSVEALIRWVQPDGKVLPPDSFLPIAENTGLIKDVTQWVLTKTCQNLEAWKNTGLDGVPISINVSAIDFSDARFLENVLGVIQHYDIDHSLLEFELTETVFFNDVEMVKNIMAVLHQNGIKLAIDDFGTGYSSFSYLQDLDLNFLKIDRSFITNVDKNERSLAIVKSIVDIGLNLGLEVIAEGIETEQELQCLRRMGCDYGQGYLFSKPLPEQELRQFVQSTSLLSNQQKKI